MRYIPEPRGCTLYLMHHGESSRQYGRDAIRRQRSCLLHRQTGDYKGSAAACIQSSSNKRAHLDCRPWLLGGDRHIKV